MKQCHCSECDGWPAQFARERQRKEDAEERAEHEADLRKDRKRDEHVAPWVDDQDNPAAKEY